MKVPDDARDTVRPDQAAVMASVQRTCERARLALLRGADHPGFVLHFAAWIAACERAAAGLAAPSH